MPYAPHFVLRSFDSLSDAAKLPVLLHLLEALVSANAAHLREAPATPSLYESGIRYEEEPPGRDEWQDIPETLARGVGDCEDLACWRIAELRVREGEHAVPIVKRTELGKLVVFHVAVQRADGRLEDPSRRLGMRT